MKKQKVKFRCPNACEEPEFIVLVSSVHRMDEFGNSLDQDEPEAEEGTAYCSECKEDAVEVE